MNKKGGEKVLSIWWFFVLALIAGGIVIGVAMFYGANVDVRDSEAAILADKLIQCFIDNSMMGDLSSENVYEKCGLYEPAFKDRGIFYFRISLSDDGDLISEIKGGDNTFEENCKVSEKTKADKFPKCAWRYANVIYDDEGIKKEGKIEVLAGSNQKGGTFVE